VAGLRGGSREAGAGDGERASGGLRRRHVLSVDDGPFRKFHDLDAPIIGVITAGRGFVEGILTTRFPVDGDAAAETLARWIEASRFKPVLRAVLVNGITIAGLAVVDIAELSRRLGLPVISVVRRCPESSDLIEALRAAGLEDRIPIVERSGPFHPFRGVHFTAAGIDPALAAGILEAEEGRSHLPEGIRLAHIIGQGIILGESRGRA
jgi:endonuclease V-like protein UPF0215 family